MLEPNNIYLGDCFELIKDVPDRSIDLVVTDPPYLHTKGRGINKKTGKAYADGHSAFAKSDLFSTKGFMMSEMSQFGDEEIDKILTEFVRVLKKPNMYIFCNETQVPRYAIWAENNGLMFSILVWEKPLSIINRNRFSQNVEFIVRIYDYGTALNRIEFNTIYNRVRKVPLVPPTEKVHPTQKPLSLVESYIMLSSQPNDIILDAFAGSGTTCVAAIKQGRRYIGMEKSPKYHKIACERVRIVKSQPTIF